MKTPEQIADEVLARPYVGGFTNSGNPFNRRFEKALIVAGIEAERAQRRELAFEALRRWDEKFETEFAVNGNRALQAVADGVDTVDSMLEYLEDGFGATARNDGLFEPDEIAEAVEALRAIKKEGGDDEA